MSLVLSVSDPAKPRIGYDNLLLSPGATVTASSEAAGYPFENAYDWNPSTQWLPNAAGAEHIQLVLASARTASYFGMYAQTLFTNGGSVQLQYSLDAGATWLPAFTAYSPLDSSPVYIRFPEVTATYWRVVVTSTPASLIGVVAFGQDMEFERGFFVGFTPPIVSRMTDVLNSVSMNGTFMGRSIIKRGITGAINSDFFSQQWIRSVWLPFVKHAELRPWFLKWNPANYPFEVAFCWTDGSIPANANTKAGAGFMNVNLTYAGNVE